MIKLELHTHSIASHDGLIREGDYIELIEKGDVDVFAITDHNTIDFASYMQKKYPKSFIVGEEVSTTEGHIIGLFIKEGVPKGVTSKKAVEMIKNQGGLVYVPHPFDKRRSGISRGDLFKILKEVDIIEKFNARYVTPFGNKKAKNFSDKFEKVTAVGSDAHSKGELGKNINFINGSPTSKNLIELLSISESRTRYISPLQYFTPTLNKLKKSRNESYRF